MNNIVQQENRETDARTQVLSLRTHPRGGIALMHTIRKGQPDCAEGQVAPAAAKFFSLAF